MGCDTSKDLVAPENEQRSTFIISTISGSSEVSKINRFEIPRERLFNFKACLKDNLHNKNINNQVFSIHSATGEIVRKMSNESGCIFWSENISYNHFENSKYLFMERSIRSEGIHKGAYTVPLAVNPWLHGEKLDEVVDLRQNSVVRILNGRQTLEVMNRGAAVTAKPVYVSDLGLKITEARYFRDTTFYQVELNTSPKVLLKNTQDQLVEVDVMGGDFELEFFLIHEAIKDQNQSRIALTNESNKFSAINIRGQIQSTFTIGLKEIPTDGFYRVLLKVKPIEGEKFGLLPGVAVFDLGEAGAITGNKSGKLLTEVVEARGDYKTLDYIDLNAKNESHLKEGFIRTGVYVKENLKLSFKSFANETTTERDVVFDVTACLGRNDGKNIGLREIEVHKIRRKPLLRNPDETVARLPLVGSELFESSPREVKPITLQTSQCLTWEDSFRHRYFVPERKAIVTFKLVNEDIGLDETVDLMINPWDFGWTFGRDARIQEEEALEREKNEERAISKFFLRNYRFIEQGTSYKVDKFLKLQQVSHLRFSLDPKAERPSSQTKGLNQVEKLRKGPYLLRILIRRNDIEDREAAHEYIAHAQTISVVTDGNMTADLDFIFTEPELLRSRNRILIELATVNQDKIEQIDENHYKPREGETYDSVIDFNSGLEPAIFEGAIVLSGNTGQNRVYPYVIDNLDILKDTMNKRFNPIFPDNYVEKLIDDVSSNYVTLGSLINLGDVKLSAERELNQRLLDQYAEYNNFDVILLDDQENQNKFLSTLEKIKSENPYNRRGSKNLNSDIFEKFLENPHSLPKFQEDLCFYFLNHLIFEKEVGGKRLGNILGRRSRSKFMMNCTNSAKAPIFDSWLHNEDGSNKFQHIPLLKHYDAIVKPSFNMTRIYMPENAEQLDHQGGIPYSYGINARYSLSRSYSWSTSFSFGGKSPAIGGIFGLSGGTGPGWRWSRGTSVGTGFGLNLDIEENREIIRLHRARHCLTVRMSPSLISSSLINYGNTNFTDDEELNLEIEALIRTSGLLVCSEKKEIPTDVLEYYYYMEQKSGPGTLQDPTDIRNRQVRLKIRGKNEFFTFISNFEGELSSPFTVMAVSEPDLFGNTYEYMKDNVNSVPASYPGIYVDLEESSAIYRSYYNQ